MTQSRAEATYEIDEARHSVNLTRHLTASVEQAFAFWTDPRHVKHWWDASEGELLECKIDLRVGGQLHFVSPRPGVPVKTLPDMTPLQTRRMPLIIWANASSGGGHASRKT